MHLNLSMSVGSANVKVLDVSDPLMFLQLERVIKQATGRRRRITATKRNMACTALCTPECYVAC